MNKMEGRKEEYSVATNLQRYAPWVSWGKLRELYKASCGLHEANHRREPASSCHSMKSNGRQVNTGISCSHSACYLVSARMADGQIRVHQAHAGTPRGEPARADTSNGL